MGVESKGLNININEFKWRGQHEKHAVGTCRNLDLEIYLKICWKAEET
jgi:hypothetical protein